MVEKVNAANRGSNTHTAETKTTVYPNPTSGITNIRLNGTYENGIVNISVYDLFGKLVMVKATNYFSGDLLNVDISALPAAMYNIGLSQNGRTEHFKLLKQN